MKTMTKHLLGLLFVFLNLHAAGTAQANLLTYQFTGEITFVDGNPLGLNSNLGDDVTGILSYDPDLAPDYSSLNLAGYTQAAPSGMTLEINGITLQSLNSSSFQVENNVSGSDGINGFFSSVSINGVPAIGSMGFKLSDTSAAVFADASLPLTLNIADFNLRNGSVFQGSNTVFFSIDTLTQVPIPSAIWLFGVALFGIVPNIRWRGEYHQA